jgi:hypothetical protein
MISYFLNSFFSTNKCAQIDFLKFFMTYFGIRTKGRGQKSAGHKGAGQKGAETKERIDKRAQRQKSAETKGRRVKLS